MRPVARHLHTAVVSTLAVITLGVVGACASGTPEPGPTSAAPQFPVTVGSLTLDKRPERIVSLSPTATEVFFAIDAGGQVVAADSTSNYPPQAPTTALSAYQPSAEAIAKHQPDLVVLSDDLGKIMDQLKTLKIPAVLMPAAKSLDDSYGQITDLGRLTGHVVQAEALVARMRTDIAKLIADVPARTKPLTFYYELDNMYYTVTSKTFIGLLLSSVGLVNIADSGAGATAYPQLSAEVIVDASPDLIFLADTKCCGQSPATVASRAGWGSIAAVRNGGVIALDDDIASRWGPRVVDLLRTITDAVARAPRA